MSRDTNVYGHANIMVTASLGLWDVSGNLLRSATLAAGTSGTLIGDFRYASIASFVLTPGTDYVVGTYLPFDLATSLFTGQGGTGFVDPNVNIIQDRFSNFNSAFSFPNTTNNHPGGWLGGNFTDNLAASSVPEPSTLALFGAGLAGLGVLRRRRKAKA